MERGTRIPDTQLLDSAIQVLSRRLPSGWAVEKTPIGGDPEPRDLVIKGPNASSQVILVEARPNVSARDVQVLMGGPWRRWRAQTGNQPILLVAPYIGPRVRELLIEETVGYVDLTGNVRISLDYPGVFIQTEGAQRDPSPAKPRRGLRGAKVGAVVRVLADAAPPYTGAEIADVANVNQGYLSRILDTLREEGLIEREGAGPITDVDWPAMLRRRAQALDLFRVPGAHSFVARQGPRRLLDHLRERQADPPPTITGSFAAARLAPVAAPSLLVVYTMTPGQLAAELDLLPSEAGADTILLRPDNGIAFERPTRDDGLAWAAPSQVAIDSLAGSGRMPAEGEALIEWMRENEDDWRYPSIEALADSTDPQKG